MDSVLVQCISILADAHSLMPVEISTELIWMKLKESICLFFWCWCTISRSGKTKLLLPDLLWISVSRCWISS